MLKASPTRLVKSPARAALLGITLAGAGLGLLAMAAPQASEHQAAGTSPLAEPAATSRGAVEGLAAAPRGASLSSPKARLAAEPSRKEVTASVARGLKWLADTQSADGSWRQNVGYKRNDDYVVTASDVGHVGVTSLALMAYLSGGHLPERGSYGEVVSRGVEWLVRATDPATGYVSEHDTRVYSHAFATLLLAEVVGMTDSPKVREALQRAVDHTVDNQNALGSWRYRPGSSRADLSITVCQIMALRAARNCGLRVPKAAIDRAVQYVERSAVRNQSSRNYGGFQYKIERRGRRVTFPITAAGVATLNHGGIYAHDLLPPAFAYLERNLQRFNRRHQGHYFFWYGHYYAAQAWFLSDDEAAGGNGPRFREYWQVMAPLLMGMQRRDGSWPNPVGPGPVFGTSVACIVLQVPNRYLPILHR